MEAVRRNERIEQYEPNREEKKLFFFSEKVNDKEFHRCSLCHPEKTKCQFGDHSRYDEKNFKPDDSIYRANKTSVSEAAISHFDKVHSAAVGAMGKSEFEECFLKPAQRAHGLTPAISAMERVVYDELNCQLNARQEYGLSLALQYVNLSIFNSTMWLKATRKFRPHKVGCYESALALCHEVRDICRNAALKDLVSTAGKNIPVYAALDKGTIYQGMIAYVIVAKGKPIIWRIASMSEQRYSSGATKEALSTEIKEMYAALKNLGVKLVSVVTDNASNMRAAKEAVIADTPLVCLPCFAHLAQLVVEDVRNSKDHGHEIALAVDEAKQKRTKLLAASDGAIRPPCPVATRWMYDFRLLNYFAAEREKADVDRRFDKGWDPTGAELNRQKRVLELLRPAAEFTDYVQRDNATLLEALCALSLFTESSVMKHALFARINFIDPRQVVVKGPKPVSFFCNAAFILCLLAPNFNIGGFIGNNHLMMMDVHTVFAAVLSEPTFAKFMKENDIEGIKVLSEVGIGHEAMATNLRRLYQCGQFYASKMCAETYKKCFDAPTLAGAFSETWKLLSLLGNMLPTEAVCERAFSILKRIKHGQASTMKVENAAAMLEIRFLAAKAWNEPAEDDFRPIFFSNNNNKKKSKPTYFLSSEIAQVFVRRAVVEFQSNSEMNANKACLHCGKPFQQNSQTIQCKNEWCAKTWHIGCLAAGNGLADEVTFEPGMFQCRDCWSAELHGETVQVDDDEEQEEDDEEDEEEDE